MLRVIVGVIGIAFATQAMANTYCYYTYTDWGACVDGVQTRTLVSISSPSVIGPVPDVTWCDDAPELPLPILSQSCLPPPPPPPPPPTAADCSPGYYKNHIEVWCAAPADGGCNGSLGGKTCEQLYNMLSAQLGATAASRAEAKGILDACYGTAASSPCTDDD